MFYLRRRLVSCDLDCSVDRREYPSAENSLKYDLMIEKKKALQNILKPIGRGRILSTLTLF
tara:strand:- start:1026 stop:1208 length:183 start_codon:yes stop_codon:yes gene_type:complete